MSTQALKVQGRAITSSSHPLHEIPPKRLSNCNNIQDDGKTTEVSTYRHRRENNSLNKERTQLLNLKGNDSTSQEPGDCDIFESALENTSP